MIPTLALPGERMPGQLGPTRRQPGCRAGGCRRALVVGGDALSDCDHERDAGVLGLEDRVGGEARGHEDHRRVRAGLGDRVVEGVEDGDALDVLAALARRHARHDLRAVAAVVHRMERALAPGDARDAELRALVDEDAHLSRPPPRVGGSLSVSVPSPAERSRPGLAAARPRRARPRGARRRASWTPRARWAGPPARAARGPPCRSCRPAAPRRARSARSGRTPRSGPWRPRRSA